MWSRVLPAWQAKNPLGQHAVGDPERTKLLDDDLWRTTNVFQAHSEAPQTFIVV